MRARTYTEHKLTDPLTEEELDTLFKTFEILRRLSQIVNGRHTHYGNSLTALERRGLVTYDGEYPRAVNYRATDAGREALDQARREGW